MFRAALMRYSYPSPRGKQTLWKISTGNFLLEQTYESATIAEGSIASSTRHLLLPYTCLALPVDIFIQRPVGCTTYPCLGILRAVVLIVTENDKKYGTPIRLGEVLLDFLG